MMLLYDIYGKGHNSGAVNMKIVNRIIMLTPGTKGLIE